MKTPVLLVGSFLSATHGNHNVCEDLAARLTPLGWPVLTTSHKPGRLARLLDMVSTAWLKRHDYAVAQVDVFSGLGFVWAEAVCAMLRLVGKPFVLTLRGGNLPAFARRWPRRVRRLFASASAITTPSRYLLEEMAPYHSHLRLQPNPLDLKFYQYRMRERPQPRMVWLRAFHSVYNPSLAARALALLTEEFPDACLFMVGHDKGDGSLQTMRRIAAELGVSERITTPGGVPKSEVSGWLQKGDIFINTTNVDNTPVSVLEAMACGLCVVSTNVGGLPYLLEHEHDSLLVPPDNPEALAAAVRRVLTEPGLAARLSNNARRKTEMFDWSVVLPQWEQLLMSVAKGEVHGRSL